MHTYVYAYTYMHTQMCMHIHTYILSDMYTPAKWLLHSELTLMAQIHD